MFWNTFIYQILPELLWPFWQILRRVSSHFFVVVIFVWIFGFCWSMRRVSSYFLTHALTSCWCWMLRGGHGVLRWRCRRSVNEDELEELVDRPGTTKGTEFAVLQSIFLPFLMRCGFWPPFQWWLHQWSSQSFPSERTAGVSSRSITVKNKSN